MLCLIIRAECHCRCCFWYNTTHATYSQYIQYLSLKFVLKISHDLQWQTSSIWHHVTRHAFAHNKLGIVSEKHSFCKLLVSCAAESADKLPRGTSDRALNTTSITAHFATSLIYHLLLLLNVFTVICSIWLRTSSCNMKKGDKIQDFPGFLL